MKEIIYKMLKPIMNKVEPVQYSPEPLILESSLKTNQSIIEDALENIIKEAAKMPLNSIQLTYNSSDSKSVLISRHDNNGSNNHSTE